MKKIYLITLSLLSFSMMVYGQGCTGGRYASDIFTTVNITSDVNFGQNTSFTGGNTVLDMDIYEPDGDTETARPLIIWAHGGSFIGGTKTDPDVTELADRFAKKGFVCASIDYRTGMWPIDSVNAIKAVIRAVQDLRAAVRFFYADAANADAYKIDTTRIFIGGSSAGAITALHMAYLDQECEIEEFISLNDLNALGGLEGTSGNPGYSSDVAGVINLCGALARYGYIEAGDPPVVSLHGDDDGTVPYARGVASVSGFAVIHLDGSRLIDEQANSVGVSSNFYTHYGGGHAVYLSSSAYMDTTVNFVRDFLIDQFGCTETPLQAPNTPTGNGNLYQLYYCSLGMEDQAQVMVKSIYPNPSNDQVTVVFESGIALNEVALIDLSGRTIATYTVNASTLVIQKNDLNAGVYILKTTNDKGEVSTSKIIFQ
ncbi:MAG: T9SS type A sorting domain-containing protein [Crocinitomicaceae bacterium]|nr:T9SS type A sorting domain-containing protein [Crocinitomicaceae bacterium]